MLAIVVIVGHSHAHAPAAARQARFLGDVLESAVSLLVIEGDHRIAAGAISLHRRAVDEDNVETAIVVAIEESSAAAGRINDVVRFGSGDVNGGETNFLGDVLEGGDGWQAAAIFLGRGGKLWERDAGAAGLLAGSLRARGGGDRENENESEEDREKTSRENPEHVLIVSQRVLRP